MLFSGDTALITSVREKSPVFDILINAGADITIQNPENGRTVLHVAVAYNRQTKLKKCVQHPSATITFAEVEDVQAETALMIAVKLQKIELIKILTTAFAGLNGINTTAHESVLHTAIYYDTLDILKHLLQTTSSASLHFQDSLNRTPVHYAAELDKQLCFQVLIECGADFYQKNTETGETVLHVVAKHNSNFTLPYILSLPHVSWFFLQKDFEGNTPYLSAIKSGNDNFLRETFKLKKIDLCDYNTDGETPTYYTVKQGFPNILRTLLLSPKYYDFAKQKQNEIDLEDPKEIVQAEIRGDIYATDVYILLKKVIRQPLNHWFPPNLLMKTKKSRSVFHACALGANLECLEFLYEFFKLFAPRYLEDVFDKPGVNGNTPLLLAAQCEPVAIPCVEFLINHGADLSAVNKKGLNVIRAIITNSPDEVYLFKSLFDGCVSAKQEEYYSNRLNIRLDFSILCPMKEAQTSVVALLFNEVLGEDRPKILQHPVIIVFLKEKIRNVRMLFYLRFVGLCTASISVSIIIPLLYIPVHDQNTSLFLTAILRALLFVMVFLLIFNGFFKLPLLMNKAIWFTDHFSFIPPVSILALVLFGKSFYFAPEIGAIAILSSWIMTFLFSVNIYSSFSYQISVFFRLLNNISKHLIVLTVIIFAFALSFSCLYHREERFSHFPTSFIYTFTVMLPGFLSDLPTFKKEYFTGTLDEFHFSIECFVITIFILVAITAFVNMLVGLAVQGGRHLEVDGKIFKNHHETHYLMNLEFCFRNKVYFWLVKSPMFKFMRGWKQKLQINLTLDIYGKDNQHSCDDTMIRQFRKIVHKRAKTIMWKGTEHFGSENFEDVFDDPFGHLPGAKEQSNKPYEKKSLMRFLSKSEPVLLPQSVIS